MVSTASTEKIKRVKGDSPRKNQQISRERQKGGNSDGTMSLGALHRCSVYRPRKVGQPSWPQAPHTALPREMRVVTGMPAWRMRC